MQKVLLACARATSRITGAKAIRPGSLFFVLLAVFVSVSAVLSIYAGKVTAAPNDTINFQARLLRNTGSVVSDGFYTVEFNIYAQSSGGTTQWTETQALTAKNGYLTANLGSVTAFSGIDWSQEQWLSMNVNGDGEMSPRMKITAVPLAFRAVQADSLTTTTGTVTADNLAQIAPGSPQSSSSSNSLLRLNQTGSGGLLQLQANGIDILTVSGGGELDLAGGIAIGNSSSTTAGTLRWSGSDFEGYNGTDWVSLTSSGGGGGGGAANSSASFVSSVANMAGTATTAAGFLNFTSATAVSNTAGTTTGFVAPADGSFRSCMVNNNAAVTAGSVSVRWRVNGAVTGTAACTLNTTNTRFSASAIDPGVVTFSAGDTIAISFQSSGLTPAGSMELTAYWAVEYNSSAILSSNAFLQGGNDFGSTAVLGTTDSFGLSLITGGTSRLSVSSSGSVNILQDLSVGNGLLVNSGGANITGNSLISGTLSGLTGLTVASGGADISGGLVLNGGDITGLGNNLTASGGLLISTGAGTSLTLDSGNDVLILNDAILQRTAAGTTTLELTDSADTLLSILNGDGSAEANLQVEGSVTASDFVGSGASLTNLNADNIAIGTLNDARLSSNVALLNTSQTFSALQTLSSGLVLGNTANTAAGTLRWTGADFEGYDGNQWVSLTGGGGGGGGGNVLRVVKASNEVVNNSATLQNDDELFFAIEPNETIAFRFVLQANSGTTPDFRFAVSAPSGATCRVGYIDPEDATSNGQYGCGVSTDTVAGNGATDIYEITGTVTNGANAGNITLQWAQFTATAADSTVFAGSYGIAYNETAAPTSPSNVFVQGGNDFGATALLGTTAANDLVLVTNGLARLTVEASGNVTINNDLQLDSGLEVDLDTFLNGNINLGDAAGDLLTINASNVTISNGLLFDSGTLAIDSANNRIGINNANPANTLSINTPATNDTAAEVLIFTGNASQKALVLQAITGQTANILEAQDNSGNSLFAINSNGALILGNDTASPTAGQLVLNDSTPSNGFTGVLGISSLSGNRTINLPDADGTVCLSGDLGCGFVVLAPGSAQTDSSTNNSLYINKTGASGNLVLLQNNGSDVFTVGNDGALTLRLNSASALSVLNGSGIPVLTVDTATGAVRIGNTTADGTGTLLVLDTKNTAGDPAGTDGAMYYNSVSNSYRCYNDGYWSDCSATRVQDDVTITSATNNISLTLPSDGSSLQCYIKAPSLSAAARVDMRFNNVSAASSYGYNTLQNLTGANNNTSTQSSNTATEIRLTGSGTSTGSFTATVNINNFAGAPKAADWLATHAPTSGTPQRYNGSGVFYTTSGSITSVQFLTSTGNFASDTRAWCEAR
jgi:hypothetical protein